MVHADAQGSTSTHEGAHGEGVDVDSIRLVSLPFAASMLGVHVDTLYSMRERGLLRMVKVGRSTRVPYSELQRLAAGEPPT